jgi:uncharacterized membrane protein YcjF (UPF0283 family)
METNIDEFGDYIFSYSLKGKTYVTKISSEYINNPSICFPLQIRDTEQEEDRRKELKERAKQIIRLQKQNKELRKEQEQKEAKEKDIQIQKKERFEKIFLYGYVFLSLAFIIYMFYILTK